MVAPAANEAQPQGPQVPRAPQANVVQEIVAEQPPAQPILDAKGLEVMCLPFFHTSLALICCCSWPMCLLLCCCSSSPRHFNLFVFPA